MARSHIFFRFDKLYQKSEILYAVPKIYWAIHNNGSGLFLKIRVILHFYFNMINLKYYLYTLKILQNKTIWNNN